MSFHSNQRVSVQKVSIHSAILVSLSDQGSAWHFDLTDKAGLGLAVEVAHCIIIHWHLKDPHACVLVGSLLKAPQQGIIVQVRT